MRLAAARIINQDNHDEKGNEQYINNERMQRYLLIQGAAYRLAADCFITGRIGETDVRTYENGSRI